MNAETALLINQWIDKVHNPTYWVIFWLFALLILLEYSIFPKNTLALNSRYNRGAIYAKLSVLIFTFTIALSQSLLGGCAIQLIQNYLAVNYLGREYWYPFGLVFREKFSPEYWIWLRLGYIILTFLYGWWIYRYYKFVMSKLKKD